MTRSHPGFFWKLSLGFGVPVGAKTAGVLLESEMGEKRDPPSTSSYGPSTSGALFAASEPGLGKLGVQAEIHTPGTS